MKDLLSLKTLKRLAVVYIIAIVLSFTAIALLPGSAFLRAENVTPQSAALGEDVRFDFCRYSRIGSIRAIGVRTIREVSNGENSIGVFEYQFPFTIEDNGCVNLSLTNPVTGENRQPQVPGTYYFLTTVFFSIQGIEKQVTYRSSDYNYGLEEK